MRAPALMVATLANFLTPFMGSSINIGIFVSLARGKPNKD